MKQTKMEKQSKILNLSENDSKDTSDGRCPIFSGDENNPFLTSKDLTLGHLRIYLQLKFISLRKAGQAAGLSYSRIKQLVTGKYLPSKPELIFQISKAWDIDSIKLTQMFERYREK